MRTKLACQTNQLAKRCEGPNKSSSRVKQHANKRSPKGRRNAKVRKQQARLHAKYISPQRMRKSNKWTRKHENKGKADNFGWLADRPSPSQTGGIGHVRLRARVGALVVKQRARLVPERLAQRLGPVDRHACAK